MKQEEYNKFFEIAKAASKFSTYRKEKIGCAIFYKKRPITIGYNTHLETIMQKKYNKYRNFDPNSNKNCGHAEMVALDKFLKLTSHHSMDMKKVSIYVYRERADGTPAMARPCIACMAAIRDIGIKNIHYTGDNSFIYEKCL